MNLIIITVLFGRKCLGELRERGFELRVNNLKKLNLIIKINIYTNHVQRLVLGGKKLSKNYLERAKN